MQFSFIILTMAIAAELFSAPNHLAGLEKDAAMMFSRAIPGDVVTVFWYYDGRTVLHHYNGDESMVNGRKDVGSILQFVKTAQVLGVSEATSSYSSIIPDVMEFCTFKVFPSNQISLDTVQALNMTESDLMHEIQKMSGCRCKNP